MQPAFNSMTEFVQMGGAHAPFVWSAWGISLLCLLLLVWHARATRRQFFREESARQRRLQSRTERPLAAQFESSESQSSSQ